MEETLSTTTSLQVQSRYDGFVGHVERWLFRYRSITQLEAVCLCSQFYLGFPGPRARFVDCSDRKNDFAGLYEEIKAIDADEEDDKAMGDVPEDKLAQNENVSSVPF